SNANNHNAIYTTDLLGTDGISPNDYTADFGGTSSATPVVSGVIALMLQANPNLTYRDVQHILVQSATQNDPGSPTWSLNGAGYHVSEDYGFGLVNASGAVNLATNWKPVGPELLIDSGTQNVNTAIPDFNTTGLTRTFTVTPDINVEHVEVVFNATHP